MNSILIYFILGSVILIMAVIIKFMFERVSSLRNVIKQKDYAIERAAQNIKVLSEHQTAINNINKKHADIIKRIGEVKPDDKKEIDNILRDIITANNKRVQNS